MMWGQERWIGFSLLISAFIASPLWADMRERIEVQGHRGTRGLAPENTLAGFQTAIDGGADVLEMDLAVTADSSPDVQDGKLVISHDPFVSSKICINPNGAPIDEPILIRSLSLETLQKFDCGTLKNPEFSNQVPSPGAKVPTLQQVFDLVKTQKVRLNLEIKIFYDHPEWTVSPEEFAQKINQAIKENSFEERVTVQSFDPRPLAILKKLNPKLRIAMLYELSQLKILAQVYGFTEVESLPEQLMLMVGKQVGAEIVSPDYSLLNDNRVRFFKANGFRVIPWTVNQAQDWSHLIQMGVDGIITDYPAALVEYLNRFPKL